MHKNYHRTSDKDFPTAKDFFKLFKQKRISAVEIIDITRSNWDFLEYFIEICLNKYNMKLAKLSLTMEDSKPLSLPVETFDMVLNNQTQNAYQLIIKPTKEQSLNLRPHKDILIKLKHRKIMFCKYFLTLHRRLQKDNLLLLWPNWRCQIKIIFK